MATKTIVFIHGLWMHRTSWQGWMDFFNQQGYTTHSVPWPGDADTIEGCRANPQNIANRGVKEVADSIATFIATLPEPPIVIGHSFGGLLAQIILGREIASAGIAIDPAPIKGVWQLPLSALKASSPVLGNPFNLTKAISLTLNQFKYGFANALSDEEAKQLYDQWTIPAPARPLFQVASSTFVGTETKVNTSANRGPLLITGGSKDNIAPPILGKASLKKYNKSLVTDFKLFEGKGHSLILDHGWKDVASYCVEWLGTKGF